MRAMIAAVLVPVLVATPWTQVPDVGCCPAALITKSADRPQTPDARHDSPGSLAVETALKDVGTFTPAAGRRRYHCPYSGRVV